jgi:uncharacterized membrane protein YoaK (UPF0700 family)
VSFDRLTVPDWVALVAALALLFVMALDWYGTIQGDEARRIEKLAQPSGALGGEIEREVQERAQIRGEEEERNAWQADGAIDRIILLGLIATAMAAIAAAFLRAAARRFEPPQTPSALTAALAAVTGLLVAYRLVQEPGLDAATTIKAGLPLALVTLGVIALAARAAMGAEEDGSAWREPEPATASPEPAA